MPYISAETISRAISRAHTDVHPFLGITFLACKKARLPIGTPIRMSMDDITRSHLDQFHRFPSISAYYFQPFKSIKYWVEPKYPSAGLQAINTQTFGEVFKHQTGSPSWAFAENYLTVLVAKLRSLRYRRKPRLIDLAIWLYKQDEWSDEANGKWLIDRVIQEFSLSSDEIDALFDRDFNPSVDLSFASAEATPQEYLKHFDPAPDTPTDVGGTLQELRLNFIGPVDSLEIELGDRLTMVTGDNGLGKSFLLECAWWAATGDWVHDAAFPGEPRGLGGFEPSIGFTIKDRAAISRSISIAYDWRDQTWVEPRERQRLLSLGVFSAADGSFAVYDPTQPRGRGRRRHSITLSQNEVWRGSGEIEGIVRDWIRWEQADDQATFTTLCSIIEQLSPDDLGILKPGKSVRIPGDRRDIPTIVHPYGATPILFASAGVKRVLALAYLITWALHEHRLAAERQANAPLERLLVVIDEIESHLHPKWQRTILPALVSSLSEVSSGANIQIVVATHSPLVLSSIEGLYDRTQDRSYHFRLDEGAVTLEELEYSKQGDVSQWLTSPFIGLSYARSKAAELAIAQAIALQENDEPSADDVRKVDAALRKTLSATDKFWPRWTFFASRHGAAK